MFTINIIVLTASIQIAATQNGQTLNYVCSSLDFHVFINQGTARVKILSDSQEREFPALVTDISVNGVAATDTADLISKLSVITF